MIKHFQINCEENDSIDIKCGGAYILGYDFCIETDEDNIEAVKCFIVNTLKKYKQPLMSINVYDMSESLKPRLWTLREIEKCIKEGY